MKECHHKMPLEILLVEDNPADARIAVEAAREGRICKQMKVVSSGEEALAYLHQEGEYRQARPPDLILLDFNLPGMDGRQVLAAIKQDPRLALIPVIILTTSEAEQDVADAYRLRANCYIVKPLTYERMLAVLQEIGRFWFEMVKLPQRGMTGKT